LREQKTILAQKKKVNPARHSFPGIAESKCYISSSPLRQMFRPAFP